MMKEINAIPHGTCEMMKNTNRGKKEDHNA